MKMAAKGARRILPGWKNLKKKEKEAEKEEEIDPIPSFLNLPSSPHIDFNFRLPHSAREHKKIWRNDNGGGLRNDGKKKSVN